MAQKEFREPSREDCTITERVFVSVFAGVVVAVIFSLIDRYLLGL